MICQAEITLICLNQNTTIQLFAGVTPLTNPFPVTTTDTQLTLQAIITANTLSGVTITIQDDSVFPLSCPFIGPQGRLHLLVEVETTSEITGVVSFTDSNEGFGNVSTVPFTCIVPPTPRRKNKKRVVGILPYIDVFYPVGSVPLQAVNYNGFTYDNPILIASNFDTTTYPPSVETSNLNLSKSNINRMNPPLLPSPMYTSNLNLSKSDISKGRFSSFVPSYAPNIDIYRYSLSNSTYSKTYNQKTNVRE